ncbi:MAG: hypothetical protein GF311_28130 [Candidatus Lokiarchaeota archaeon]|nr:hypothetical protein [Candidatus Lokiarchaeota archaeon]
MLYKDLIPYKYKDVAGHTKIVKDLIGCAKNGRSFSEVMFFIGPTGTGKGVLATITAMLINCENPKENEPCGECDSCRSAIEEKFNLDIQYINCSDMKKEDVLSLEDQVNFAPIFSKNKVYILDEAQELSARGARNATLSLLQKKRKNVYFILCTMDGNAFDKAVLDRGQVYRLFDLEALEIGNYLCDFLEDNQEVPDDFFGEPLSYITSISNGSMRKALQVLERCLRNNIFTKEAMEETFKEVSEDAVREYIFALLEKNKDVVFKIVKSDVRGVCNYGIKILLDSLQYQVCGRNDLAWKEKVSIKVCAANTFKSLLEIFMKHSNYYFNEQLFLYDLLQYLNVPLEGAVIKRRVIG